MDISFDANDSGILANSNEINSRNFNDLDKTTPANRSLSTQVQYSFEDSRDNFQKNLNSNAGKTKDSLSDYYANDKSFNFDRNKKNMNNIVFFTESSESESYSRASSPRRNSGNPPQNQQFNRNSGPRMTESIQLGLQDLLLQRKFLEEQRRKFYEINRKKEYTQAQA